MNEKAFFMKNLFSRKVLRDARDAWNALLTTPSEKLANEGEKFLLKIRKNLTKNHFCPKFFFPQNDALDTYKGVVTSKPENCQLNSKTFPLNVQKGMNKKQFPPKALILRMFLWTGGTVFWQPRRTSFPQAPKKFTKRFSKKQSNGHEESSFENAVRSLSTKAKIFSIKVRQQKIFFPKRTFSP